MALNSWIGFLRFVGIIGSLITLFCFLYLAFASSRFNMFKQPLSVFGSSKKRSKLFKLALISLSVGQLLFVSYLGIRTELFFNSYVVLLILFAVLSVFTISVFPHDTHGFWHVASAVCAISLSLFVSLIFNYYFLLSNQLMGKALFVSSILFVGVPILSIIRKRKVMLNGFEEILIVCCVLLWDSVATFAII